MSAIAQAPLAREYLGNTAPIQVLAIGFAEALLEEQRVPVIARRSAARALGLLIEESVKRPGEPVVISAREGASLAEFDPRTWWSVKRRLLGLGHLVATTGGGPPSGQPGGRGRKGAYFVAPATLARFQTLKGPAQTTLNACSETVKGLPETLNGRAKPVKGFLGEMGNLSHHRPLRLLKKENTSDVPSFEGDESSRHHRRPRHEQSEEAPALRLVEPPELGEKPTPEAIWAAVQRETSTRVKLRLLRLLETLLLGEALENLMASRETVKGREETRNAPRETVNEASPPAAKPTRRKRAEKPLWSATSGEEKTVFGHVREILAWANREHGATFDVERSSQDTLRYPFERVRGAVANVLLKKARGYRFANAGAVLWDGITLEGYKLEEFSVGPFAEVLERAGLAPGHAPRDAAPDSERVGKNSSSRRPQKSPGGVADPPLRFESERKRRLLLQAIYEKLPAAVRQDLDERALALARTELGAEASPRRLGFLRLDKRNELLVREHADARRLEVAPEESQIPGFGSGRDDTEPNVLHEART